MVTYASLVLALDRAFDLHACVTSERPGFFFLCKKKKTPVKVIHNSGSHLSGLITVTPVDEEEQEDDGVE